MTWQLLLLISMAANAGMTLSQKVLMKSEKSDPVTYSILFQVLAGAFIGIFAFFRGFELPTISPIIPNIILMPILYILTNVFVFKSLKLIDASEYTVFFTSRSFWTILAAVIFLHESFSFQQAIGTILIFLSIVLVSWKTKKIVFGKGQFFALLGAIAFGLALANDSIVVAHADVPTYMMIAFFLPALLMMGIYPSSLGKMKKIVSSSGFLQVAVPSFFAGASTLGYFFAYQAGRNAAQIASVNQFSSIVIVLLAIFLLKEKSDILKKLIAIVISVVGVLLVL